MLIEASINPHQYHEYSKPEMIIDESDNVRYDCPGLGDKRNETVEKATTFSIESVIENASNMKVVLVVDYDLRQAHLKPYFQRPFQFMSLCYNQ